MTHRKKKKQMNERMIIFNNFIVIDINSCRYLVSQVGKKDIT